MKRASFLMLVSAILLILSGAAHATIMVEFAPTPVDVTVGTSFTVDLIADIPQNEWVNGFGLEVLYDETLLSLDLIDVNRDPSAFPFNTTGMASSDVVEGLYGITSNQISGDDLRLATLHFTCLGEGLTALELTRHPDEYLDYYGGAFFGSIMLQPPFARDWGYEGGLVNQAPVPEPATMLLLGSGLLGLAGFRKRFRKT